MIKIRWTSSMTNQVYYTCGGGVEIGLSSSILCFDNEYSACVDWGGGYETIYDEPDISNEQIIDALVISHAHHDHCAMVPCFASRYPNARIFATEATKILCEMIWIQNVDRNKDKAPFTKDEVYRTLNRIEIINFGETVNLTNDLSMLFVDAGHILGSVSVYFIYKGDVFVITSDVCMRDRGLLKGANFPNLNKVRLLVRESTNINRKFESRREINNRLISTVNKILSDGGKILVPAFSVDRAQEVYLLLKSLSSNIYMDGAKHSTDIYERFFPESGLDRIKRFVRPLFNFDGSFNNQGERERRDFISSCEPGIVIATSGMLNIQTLSYWWAQQISPLGKNAIFLVSYQDPDSQGGKLLDTDYGETLVFNGVHTAINCLIDRFNLSGHISGPDGENIEGLLNPDTIVYNHGVIREIALYIHNKKGNKKRVIPEVGKWVEV